MCSALCGAWYLRHGTGVDCGFARNSRTERRMPLRSDRAGWGVANWGSKVMRRTASLVSGVLAGICAATALALPAVAGGVDHGPVVKHRVPAAVPVPAPVPVPDTASNWYVRMDAAYSLSDVDKYNAEAPFNDDALRSDQGLDQFGRYGLGVGYHFSRWLRADVTLDLRSEVKSRGVGTIVTPTATGSLRDSYFDQFRSKNWTGLANLYYDLAGWRSFTPYVGAGLGFVVHTSDGLTLNRSTATCSLTDVCTTGVVVQGTGMPLPLVPAQSAGM